MRPANEPEPEAVERLAAELAPPGWLQRALDLGSMASPRLAQWAEPGVSRSARPGPQGGPLLTKHEFPLDFAGMPGTWPGGQSVPMSLGKPASFRLRCGTCRPCAPSARKPRAGKAAA